MVKANEQRYLKILVTGGGTGGHLFPAIALMEELNCRSNEIFSVDFLFIGTERGLESSVLSNLDYPFRKIWIRGFQRGLSGHDILVNLLFPVRLMVSLIQSFFL
ncbi:MAG: glycosyltransferase, partial [Candidatus Marinimicrobia bacterium]|nr:glycosyltransferase [Candidatus Neomarinimicrobiota bacterium]